MWQRIQTVFMLLAAVLLGLLFVFPVSQFQGKGFTGALYIYGLKAVEGDMPLSFSMIWISAVLVVAIIALLLYAINRYKKRMQQLRILMIAVLLTIVMLGFLFFINDEIQKADLVYGYIKYSIGAFLPLISLLLMLMAGRSIRRDEAKVRASNRLR